MHVIQNIYTWGLSNWVILWLNNLLVLLLPPRAEKWTNLLHRMPAIEPWLLYPVLTLNEAGIPGGLYLYHNCYTPIPCSRLLRRSFLRFGFLRSRFLSSMFYLAQSIWFASLDFAKDIFDNSAIVVRSRFHSESLNKVDSAFICDMNFLWYDE